MAMQTMPGGVGFMRQSESNLLLITLGSQTLYFVPFRVNLYLHFCLFRHFTPPHISGLRRAKKRKASVGVTGLRLFALASLKCS